MPVLTIEATRQELEKLKQLIERAQGYPARGVYRGATMEGMLVQVLETEPEAPR